MNCKLIFPLMHKVHHIKLKDTINISCYNMLSYLRNILISKLFSASEYDAQFMISFQLSYCCLSNKNIQCHAFQQLITYVCQIWVFNLDAPTLEYKQKCSELTGRTSVTHSTSLGLPFPITTARSSSWLQYPNTSILRNSAYHFHL